MRTVVHENADQSTPGGDVDLLIGKGFLLLGSIEFQIDEHLMSHGTRIAPETRFFMARMRDAAGDAATRLLDETRHRLDAPPPALVPECAVIAAGEDQHPPAAADRPFRLRAAPWAVLSGAAQLCLGTASAGLVLALLLGGPTASLRPAGPEAAAGALAERDATGSARAERAAEAVAAAWLTEVTLPAATDLAAQPADEDRRVDAGSTPPSRLLHPPSELAATVPTADRSPLDGAFSARSVLPASARASGTADAEGASQEEPAVAGSVEAAETALALSPGIRREVQRRLALADNDPLADDGIFGPRTRAAIGEWQKAAGLPATGFLDAVALALLREQTADAYRRLPARQSGRGWGGARTVMASPVPPASPTRFERCDRTRTGRIAYGRSVRCDFRGLRQSIARLLG